MKKFEPTRNMGCICGSAKKFKKCCQNTLPVSSLAKLAIEIENENFELAYIFCRAELARYMIQVKRHTEVLLSVESSVGHQLLEIDIKALSELLGKLMFIINKGQIEHSFMGDLIRLGELLYSQRWHTRLIYYKVAWEFLFNDNEAKTYLSNILYKEIDGLDFLQMYLDLMSDDLSFSNRIEIIEKLITIEVK